MGRAGTVSHIDVSVGSPARSIPFYEALLTAIGFQRMVTDHPGFGGKNPERAWWAIEYPDGSRFGIEARPADPAKSARRYDRAEPGPHHIAFHANSRAQVDAVHQALVAAGADVLDPPTDYSGRRGYSEGYYAVFVADPDGVKLEVVHMPVELE